MCRIAVFVAVLSLFSITQPADARSDAERQGLKGRVKQVVTERADYSNQDGVWTQSPSASISIQQYDTDGWLIASDEHDPRVWPHARTVVTREPDGSVTMETRLVGKDGKLLKTYVSKYDSKRNPGGASEMDAGGSVQWRETVSRNALGETVSRNALGETIQERVAADGGVFYRLSWFDNQNGFRVMDITHYQDGLPTSRARQIYNQRGQVMLTDGYASDGQPENRVVFDYGRDGELLAATSYAPDGHLLSRRIEAYDAHGDRVGATEFAYDSGERVPARTEYSYGPDGLITVVSRSGMSGLATGLHISYELDEWGNWVRQTTSHCHAVGDESERMWDDPNPCEVTIRTITYYAENLEGGVASQPTHGGTLTGKVTFSGVPPAPKIFSLSKFPNPGFCAKAESDGHGNRVIQEVNVGSDHALRDVVIAVQDVPLDTPFEFGGTKVINEGCKWLVQGGPSTMVGVVVKGKEIEIKNMDADPDDPKAATGVLHTPHAYEVLGKHNTSIFNLPLPEKGQVLRKPVILRKKGSTLLLEGDQQNFARAFFLPVENPYYAIVENDGAFTIRDIPPGTYTVLAWHPVLGRQEASVTIAANRDVRADFVFAPKWRVRSEPKPLPDHRDSRQARSEEQDTRWFRRRDRRPRHLKVPPIAVENRPLIEKTR